jgi:hypothetical protein
MCLTTVKNQVDKPSTLIESGWKYFKGSYSEPLFPHSNWNGSRRCPLDQWITASVGIEGGQKVGPYKNEYKVGFHVFTDERKAKKAISPGLRRVYFRRVTAQGTDQEIETIVAQEMYVPSKEEAWPPKGA